MKMQEKNEAPRDEDVDLERRAALAKLGAYAALSGPAVTTLLVANKASAQSMTFGGGETPGSVTVDPEEPEDNEVCIGGGGSCPEG